eukprot:CAMPEP_0176366078 /NCGR_PEP_ID=MMETSP0126-20121128/20925_1 /TAXON_ID=141414 ORGANISM="Strombidinopsis acuminatum, Strain SPMC142" /NCGR_SAMPLE_ID=MMETSP0126 /ASSEMBLY_ACC=CAM_ASM_000229 /LENGTH=101 /DNA_ID=CAMNT_0017723349 /DNA_START=349 /DNA_END=654 /DNA_ORIENTATION=-
MVSIKKERRHVNWDLMKMYLAEGTYHTAIFTYDITRKESFAQMEECFDDYRRVSATANLCNYVIVGTMLDVVQACPAKRIVLKDYAKAWVKKVAEEELYEH